MFSCESSESNPPAEIIWQVRDQHGQDITEDMEVDTETNKLIAKKDRMIIRWYIDNTSKQNYLVWKRLT